jgi:hypothetical protein
MLLVSTTKTLTTSQVSNLAAIPVIAITQIVIGAALGKLAAAAVQGRLPLTRCVSAAVEPAVIAQGVSH